MDRWLKFFGLQRIKSDLEIKSEAKPQYLGMVKIRCGMDDYSYQLFEKDGIRSYKVLPHKEYAFVTQMYDIEHWVLCGKMTATMKKYFIPVEDEA